MLARPGQVVFVGPGKHDLVKLQCTGSEGGAAAGKIEAPGAYERLVIEIVNPLAILIEPLEPLF